MKPSFGQRRCSVVWYSLAPCRIRDSRTKSLAAFDKSSADRAPGEYESRSCDLGANKFVQGQAPTAEMAVTPPSIRKSAPTTYTESSDAR
jgi:hypothetical protein